MDTDASKNICPGDVWESFWARPGVMDFTPLPLGVIVTAAGTGSEMNGGAVITNTEQKVKTGRAQLEGIAASCNLAPGSYQKMTHEDILSILNECY